MLCTSLDDLVWAGVWRERGAQGSVSLVDLGLGTNVAANEVLDQGTDGRNVEIDVRSGGSSWA